MALGCGGTNSLVINSTNGKVAVTVSGEGGTDEAWYNPTANQYYFARSTAGVLGVENAGPPATGFHQQYTDRSRLSFGRGRREPNLTLKPQEPSLCADPH
jgi:hypothetical protein